MEGCDGGTFARSGKNRISGFSNLFFPQILSHSSRTDFRHLGFFSHSWLFLIPIFPPSLASSRGRGGETRANQQPTAKWPKSGNAGPRPPADPFSHGGPNTQGQTHLLQRLGSTAGAAPHVQPGHWSKPCSVHCICPTLWPLTPTSKSQHCHTHLAFLHCGGMKALFVRVLLPLLLSVPNSWFLGFGLNLCWWFCCWFEDKRIRASFNLSNSFRLSFACDESIS